MRRFQFTLLSLHLVMLSSILAVSFVAASVALRRQGQKLSQANRENTRLTRELRLEHFHRQNAENRAALYTGLLERSQAARQRAETSRKECADKYLKLLLELEQIEQSTPIVIQQRRE